MIKCPKCGYENPDDKKQCIICDETLQQKTEQENTKEDMNRYDFNPLNNNTQEDTNSNQNPQYNNNYQNLNNQQQYNTENQNNYQYQNPGNQQYNQYNYQYQNPGYQNQQQYNPQQRPPPVDKYNPQQRPPPADNKSKIIAFLLGFFIPGTGYCYLDDWTTGIIMFLCIVILSLLSWLIVPGIAAVILWIYSMYDVNKKIDLYNNKKP